jgi:hypothetical protein
MYFESEIIIIMNYNTKVKFYLHIKKFLIKKLKKKFFFLSLLLAHA